MAEKRFHKRSVFLLLYILFALLPIYWMVNMSFKTNEEILSSLGQAGQRKAQGRDHRLRQVVGRLEGRQGALNARR